MLVASTQIAIRVIAMPDERAKRPCTCLAGATPEGRRHLTGLRLSRMSSAPKVILEPRCIAFIQADGVAMMVR